MPAGRRSDSPLHPRPNGTLSNEATSRIGIGGLVKPRSGAGIDLTAKDLGVWNNGGAVTDHWVNAAGLLLSS